MNATLSCLDGVEVAMDDVLIHAPYQELLETRSTNTLEALHLAGLKLNQKNAFLVQLNENNVHSYRLTPLRLNLRKGCLSLLYRSRKISYVHKPNRLRVSSRRQKGLRLH